MLLYCISPQIGFQTYPNFVKCNERLLRANDLPKVLERGKNITFCFNRVELEMLMRRSHVLSLTEIDDVIKFVGQT